MSAVVTRVKYPRAFAPWEFGFVCPDLNPECWGKGEYIGSAVNIIMCNSIAWPMFAGRYGLAPTERRTSGPIAGEGSLAYTDQGGESIGFGVDPAGFTIVDVIALASLGHVLGAGTCAGLAAIGQI
eukprot:PRCOL_00005455-RA